MPRPTDLPAAAGSMQEPRFGSRWAAIVPTNLDVLGASHLQLKQTTREIERIAARLAACDPAD